MVQTVLLGDYGVLQCVYLGVVVVLEVERSEVERESIDHLDEGLEVSLLPALSS